MSSSSNDRPLSGEALIKETNRRIRVAMAYWKAHNNRACRGERDKALQLYNQLTKDQKDKIPQQLRIWLRYRSVKYFGEDRTAPGTPQGHAKSPKTNSQDSQSPKPQSATPKSQTAQPSSSPSTPPSAAPAQNESGSAFSNDAKVEALLSAKLPQKSSKSANSDAKRLPHQHKPRSSRKKKRNTKLD